MREQTYREGCRSFVLSRKLTAALKGLSEQERVDLFVILLAAFKVLLARYSRQEDIVVATPVMAGSPGQTKKIETFHSSAVALRTDLPMIRLREGLYRVREVCLTANRHHDMNPWKRLNAACD
jgi:non-ribosomal peptide synthetase component F